MTVVETDNDISTIEEVNQIQAVKELSGRFHSDETKNGHWVEWLPQLRIEIRRNSALLVTNKYSSSVCDCALVFSFMNLIRHYGNFLRGETSKKMDEIGQVNGSFLTLRAKRLLLKGRFQLKEMYSLLTVLKSGYVGAYDEIKNVSLWHSPKLVRLSEEIRSGDSWNLNKELSLSFSKIDELTQLTELLYRKEIKRTRRLIAPLLALISILSVLQTIPTVKNHILPQQDIWGPIITLSAIALLLYMLINDNIE